MPRRRHKVGSVSLDLVSAIRRAHLRRGIFIAPVSADSAETENSQVSNPNTQEPQEAHEKLIDITEKAQDILFEAETIFPLTLFPDTITLDREKLTVATRYFFRTARITSVPVSSISAAEVDVGPFFGSLHISSKYFVQNRYSVQKLTRSDATTLEHLLQGFIIAQQKDIDLSDIEKEDLLILLKDLGTGVEE